MMTELIKLALKQVSDLGQEAFYHHEKLMAWNDPALDPAEKTKLSVNLKKALEEQRQWVNAILEHEDGDLE